MFATRPATSYLCAVVGLPLARADASTPSLTVSFPVPWADLGQVAPADFTIRTAPGLMDGKDPWAKLLPKPQALPADLIEHGHTIPVARVQAAADNALAVHRAAELHGPIGGHAILADHQDEFLALVRLDGAFADEQGRLRSADRHAHASGSGLGQHHY